MQQYVALVVCLGLASGCMANHALAQPQPAGSTELLGYLHVHDAPADIRDVQLYGYMSTAANDDCIVLLPGPAIDYAQLEAMDGMQVSVIGRYGDFEWHSDGGNSHFFTSEGTIFVTRERLEWRNRVTRNSCSNDDLFIVDQILERDED